MVGRLHRSTGSRVDVDAHVLQRSRPRVGRYSIPLAFPPVAPSRRDDCLGRASGPVPHRAPARGDRSGRSFGAVSGATPGPRFDVGNPLSHPRLGRPCTLWPRRGPAHACPRQRRLGVLHPSLHDPPPCVRLHHADPGSRQLFRRQLSGIGRRPPCFGLPPRSSRPPCARRPRSFPLRRPRPGAAPRSARLVRKRRAVPGPIPGLSCGVWHAPNRARHRLDGVHRDGDAAEELGGEAHDAVCVSGRLNGWAGLYGAWKRI
ncbi:hypothetical protein DFJ74DRAFT_665738 [Hyaloraphidium curvatum]|nr:hypothetical protein DFJ74DRAFT_665738 [Hyaloraphidium curvatum]